MMATPSPYRPQGSSPAKARGPSSSAGFSRHGWWASARRSITKHQAPFIHHPRPSPTTLQLHPTPLPITNPPRSTGPWPACIRELAMCSPYASPIGGRAPGLRLAGTATRDHVGQLRAPAGYGDNVDAPAYSGLKDLRPPRHAGQGPVLRVESMKLMSERRLAAQVPEQCPPPCSTAIPYRLLASTGTDQSGHVTSGADGQQLGQHGRLLRSVRQCRQAAAQSIDALEFGRTESGQLWHLKRIAG